MPWARKAAMQGKPPAARSVPDVPPTEQQPKVIEFVKHDRCVKKSGAHARRARPAPSVIASAANEGADDESTLDGRRAGAGGVDGGCARRRRRSRSHDEDAAQ